MKQVTLTLILFLALGTALAGAQQVGDPLKLSEAIKSALEHGAALRQARADREAANAQGNWLSSGYLPEIGSELSYQHSQYPQIVTPIRQQGVFPPLDDQIYSATVQANWTVFDFGEQRKARQSAMALARVSEVKYDLARMETVEQVASDYILLHQFRALLDVQRRRLTALESSRDQIKALLDKGRVARVDLLKVEEVLLEAEADLTETHNRIDQILVRLGDNMGMDTSPESKELDSLDWSRVYPYEPMDTTGAPMIQAAEQRLASAEHERDRANRMLLPEFSLFASEQIRAGSGIDPVDDQWMVGVRMRLPLFQGKLLTQRQVRQARVKSERAALELTRQRYNQRLNELNNAQFTAMKNYRTTRARLEHLEETYRIEERAYQKGRTTITDLLSTEAKKAAADVEVLRQQAQMRLLNLNLAVLTGHLSPELALKLTGGQ